MQYSKTPQGTFCYKKEKLFKVLWFFVQKPLSSALAFKGWIVGCVLYMYHRADSTEASSVYPLSEKVLLSAVRCVSILRK